MIIDPITALIAKFLIAGLFLNSALHKLKDQRAFLLVLTDYGIGEAFRKSAAVLILAAEILIMALVTISLFITLDLAMVAGLGLLGFYTCLLSFFYLTGRAVDCGCHFGDHKEPVGPWHIMRNLILMAITALYFLPQAERSLGWLDYFTAIFASLMIGLSLVIIENIKHNNNYFKTFRKTA